MSKKNANTTTDSESKRKKSGMSMLAMLGTTLSAILSLVINLVVPFLMEPHIVEKYPIIRTLSEIIAPLSLVLHLPISLLFFYMYYKICSWLFRNDRYPNIYMYLFGGIYLALQALAIFVSWDSAFMEPAVSDPGVPILLVSSVALVFTGIASALAATLIGYLIHVVVGRRERSAINPYPAEPQDEA